MCYSETQHTPAHTATHTRPHTHGHTATRPHGHTHTHTHTVRRTFRARCFVAGNPEQTASTNHRTVSPHYTQLQPAPCSHNSATHRALALLRLALLPGSICNAKPVKACTTQHTTEQPNRAASSYQHGARQAFESPRPPAGARSRCMRDNHIRGSPTRDKTYSAVTVISGPSMPTKHLLFPLWFILLLFLVSPTLRLQRLTFARLEADAKAT